MARSLKSTLACSLFGLLSVTLLAKTSFAETGALDAETLSQSLARRYYSQQSVELVSEQGTASSTRKNSTYIKQPIEPTPLQDSPVEAEQKPVPVVTTEPPASDYAPQKPTQSVFQESVDEPKSGFNLGSRTGFEVGGQISYYRYQEHVREHPEFIHEIGPKFGITATGTKVFGNGIFVAGDLRFAFGANHYSSAGSGTADGKQDYLGDIRLLGGKDFAFSSHPIEISPYLGLGYRNLYNDLRGSTSTGALGYRRDSQYLYLPVGVTPRFGLTDNSRLAINVEYDWLIQGWQASYLSDASSSLGDIYNKQNAGYGLRGSIMYEKAAWSVGPFFDYWNINQSDIVGSLGAFEPHNQTIEYGLQARYHF